MAYSVEIINGICVGGPMPVTFSGLSGGTFRMIVKTANRTLVDSTSRIGNTTSVTVYATIEYSDLPTSTSCSFETILYKDGAQVYSRSFTATLKDVHPYISNVTISKIDTIIPSSWGEYVKGQSSIRVKITGTPGTGSYLTEDSNITVGSENKFVVNTTDLYADFTPNETGNLTVRSILKDARGTQGVSVIYAMVRDYFYPSPLITAAFRCDSTGNEDVNGTYIKVLFTKNIASVNGKNSIKLATLSYKTASGSTVGTYDVKSLDSIILSGADIDTSYQLTLTLSDQLYTKSCSVSVNTATIPLDFRYNGKGVGIGKVSEHDNGLDIGYDVYIDGDKYLKVVTGGSTKQVPFERFSNDPVKIVTASITYTAAGNSMVTLNTDLDSYVPDGYKMIGSYCRYTGSSYCFCYQAKDGYIRFRNTYASSITTTCEIDIICIQE